MQYLATESVSPLNSARTSASSAAAARRVGRSSNFAKRTALAKLAAARTEEQESTLSELEKFDARLDVCLAQRPLLANPGRLSLPWTLPDGSSSVAPSHSAVMDAFGRVDADCDGHVTCAEIIEACHSDPEVRALLKLPADVRYGDLKLDEIFTRIDADASRTIDADEFVAAFAPARTPRKLPQQPSRSAFTM